MVAAFTPEPLALALGMSPTPGPSFADALDLGHRLPSLATPPLDVPVWRARRLARQTHPLPKAAATGSTRSSTPHLRPRRRLDRPVAHATAKYMPEDARSSRGAGSRQTWDVTLQPPRPPPSSPAPASSTWSATRSPSPTSTTRSAPAAAGPQDRRRQNDPLGVRKAKTLRNLTGTPKTKLYLHLDLADVEADLEVSTGSRPPKWGRGRGREPRPRHHRQDPRLARRHQEATIQPVLRMARRDAIDTHDPPAWMRDLVLLRDSHCIFPRCKRTPGCDLDHHEPLRPARTTRPNQGQPTSPPCAGDTTAPRPPVAGGTSARPTATTSGTAPPARPTSSPTAAPADCPDRVRHEVRRTRRCRAGAARPR